MYGQSDLNTILNDPAITGLLSDPSYVWYSTIQPDKGPKVSAINYYRSTLIPPDDWLDVKYSVNCRAKTEAEAEAIAREVRNVLNRHSSGSIFMTAAVLGVIRPADPTDNFNAPVEITVKGPNV